MFLLWPQAEFFNNYLSDPKRPHVPEPGLKQTGNQAQVGQVYGAHPHGGQGMMGWGGPRPPMMMYGKWEEVQTNILGLMYGALQFSLQVTEQKGLQK